MAGYISRLIKRFSFSIPGSLGKGFHSENFLWTQRYCCYVASLRRTLQRSFHYSAFKKYNLGEASKYLLSIFLLSCFISCKKPYEPEAIKAINNFLVIDGFINISANGVTTINLSRARSISDSTFDVLPEGGGNITIESNAGVSYALYQTSDGVYESQPLNLPGNQTYRVNVFTANGGKYQSDLVAVKQSPPIDSITWELKDGVTIYANTHDPSNSAKYYRWDFTETWQHTAELETLLGLNSRSDSIFFRDSSNFIYNCWTTEHSTNIALATSAALSQDVINNAPVTNIPQNNLKIGVRYSILVRQYALTPEAYQYWEIIQKNTSKIGTLFDLQPSQLHGNIRSLTNSNEPVIGFVSAGSVQQKRIFIKHSEVGTWPFERPPHVPCDLVIIGQNPNDYHIFDYPDKRYAPYYFITGGIVLSRKECFECALDGGTPEKPSFW